ncbi:MAG: hypothetical protein MUF58_19445 [Arcicella sp.]|jgi:hypothetical protein|nr:hypothetical protein [Arcicella sp.]
MNGIEEAKKRVKKCIENQETELDLSDCIFHLISTINSSQTAPPVDK